MHTAFLFLEIFSDKLAFQHYTLDVQVFIQHHKIRNLARFDRATVTEQTDRLCGGGSDHLNKIRSNSRIISSKSIADFLSSNNEKCSVHTVSNYINYIEEAFGIDMIKPFSTRTKSELSYYHKTYNADVALNSLRCTDSRYDLDHNLENIVYNELLYMDYKLKVFNDSDREVDFVAEKNGKKYFIQVAFSVQNEKAYEREFRAFANLDNLSQKILITTDDLDYSTSVVRHIKLKDFLLMEDL